MERKFRDFYGLRNDVLLVPRLGGKRPLLALPIDGMSTVSFVRRGTSIGACYLTDTIGKPGARHTSSRNIRTPLLSRNGVPSKRFIGEGRGRGRGRQ